MKNWCLTAFFFVLSVCGYGQTFLAPEDEDVLTEYNGGTLWAYLSQDSCRVGLTCYREKDEYGRYYQLGIFLQNLRRTPVTFQPDDVRCRLRKGKNDTLQLKVYSAEGYRRKVKRSRAWTAALEVFAATLDENQTVTPPSQYPPPAFRRNYVASPGGNGGSGNAVPGELPAPTARLLTLGQLEGGGGNLRREGYLKTTTLYPGQAVVGFMNVKRKRGNVLTVSISLGGQDYSFDWQVGKKKK